MQAGFALVETGFCRAKHAAHVVSTNFAIFGIGFVAFYLIGFGLMFGGHSLPLIGLDKPAVGAAIGSGNWVFLWKGGFAPDRVRSIGGARMRLWPDEFDALRAAARSHHRSPH